MSDIFLEAMYKQKNVISRTFSIKVTFRYHFRTKTPHNNTILSVTAPLCPQKLVNLSRFGRFGRHFMKETGFSGWRDL